MVWTGVRLPSPPQMFVIIDNKLSIVDNNVH
jgi:hypothetical protein